MEIGRYRLELPLGRGAMGEVWKAFDPIRESQVVIKVLPPELSGDQTELDRIKQSFLRVQGLQHQHICPVYDLGEHELCGYYLVMKYVCGKTAAAYAVRYRRERGEFPATELAKVLGPIAAALDYAHSQQIVHRDVKPQNILVRDDGTDPQLVDFGLAAEIRTSLTRASLTPPDTSGTLPYMAPEQWRGRRVDGRADQYSLAVVAYELLAGDLPFNAVDITVLRHCVLEEPLEAIPGVPLAVNAALARGLAKNPEERFPTCGEFIRALFGDSGAAMDSPLEGALSLPDIAKIVEPEKRVLAQGILLSVLIRQSACRSQLAGDKVALEHLVQHAFDAERFVTVAHHELRSAVELWNTLSKDSSVATGSIDSGHSSRVSEVFLAAIHDLLPHVPAHIAAAVHGKSIGRSIGMIPTTTAVPIRPALTDRRQVATWLHGAQSGYAKIRARSVTAYTWVRSNPRRLTASAVCATVILLCVCWTIVGSAFFSERSARAAQGQAEDARNAARKSQADVLATDYWSNGEREFNAGMDLHSKEMHSQARASYDRAVKAYNAAQAQAEARAVANAAHDEAIADQATSKAADAPNLATQDWDRANAALHEGEVHLKNDQHAKATDQFREAKSLYAKAKNTAASAQKLAVKANAARDDMERARTAVEGLGFDHTQTAAWSQATAQESAARAELVSAKYADAEAAFRSAEKLYRDAERACTKERLRRDAVGAKEAASLARIAALNGNSDNLKKTKQWLDAEAAWKRGLASIEREDLPIAAQELTNATNLYQEASSLANIVKEIHNAKAAIQELGVDQNHLEQRGGRLWKRLNELIAVVEGTNDFTKQQAAAQEFRAIFPQALNVGRALVLAKDKKYGDALDLILASWPDRNDSDRRNLFNSCARYVPDWWRSQAEKAAATVATRDLQLVTWTELAMASAMTGQTQYSTLLGKAMAAADDLTDAEFKVEALMHLARCQKEIGHRDGVRDSITLATRAASLLPTQRRPYIPGSSESETVPARAWHLASLAGFWASLNDQSRYQSLVKSAYEIVAYPTAIPDSDPNPFCCQILSCLEMLPSSLGTLENLRNGRESVGGRSHRENKAQKAAYDSMSAVIALRAAETKQRELYDAGRFRADELRRSARQQQETISRQFFRASLTQANALVGEIDDARALFQEIEAAQRALPQGVRPQDAYYAQAISQASAALAVAYARRGETLKAKESLRRITLTSWNTITNRYLPVGTSLAAYGEVAVAMARAEPGNLADIEAWIEELPTPAARACAFAGVAQALTALTDPTANPSRLKLAATEASEDPIPSLTVRPTTDALALSALQRAAQAADRGQVDQAIEECNGALALDPFAQDAYRLRARMHLARNDFRSAMADARTAGDELSVTVTAKSGELRAGAQTIALPRGTKLHAVDIETYGDNDWLRVVSYVDSTGAERKIDYAATDRDGNDFRATYAFIAVNDVRVSNLLAWANSNQPDQVGARMRAKSGHSRHSSTTDVSDVIDVVRKVKPFLPGKVGGYIPF